MTKLEKGRNHMQKTSKLKMALRQGQIFIIFVVLFIVSSLLNPRFFSVANLTNIMRQVSVNGILACGMTFVMLTGGFDLSVGATLTIAGATALKLQPVLGVGGAIIAAIAIGAIFGSLIGLVLAKINACSGDAFMIKLGAQFVIFGISLEVYDAKFIIGSKDPFYNWIGTGNVGIIPVSVIIFAAVAIISHLILRYTRFGRNVFYTGGNYEAARLSGVNTRFYKGAVYAVVGITAALASVVLTARTAGCSSDLGSGYELDAISAVMVGGTSTAGGEGSILRTIIGVLIIGVLSNTLNLMGMSSFNQMIAKGIVVVLAVWLDNSRRNQ